uniref:Putative secreted protein n=1 Tax=Anopheles darlingi TaxID=43151 RepID=A0A2M4DLQ6_ANODA
MTHRHLGVLFMLHSVLVVFVFFFRVSSIHAPPQVPISQPKGVESSKCRGGGSVWYGLITRGALYAFQYARSLTHKRTHARTHGDETYAFTLMQRGAPWAPL